MEKILAAVSESGNDNFGVSFVSSDDYLRRVYDDFGKEVAENICLFVNTLLTEKPDDDEIEEEYPVEIVSVGKCFYVTKDYLTVDGQSHFSSHGFLEKADATRCAQIVEFALNCDGVEYSVPF